MSEAGTRFDLHTHSDRSDGALAPAELVQRAAASGIEVMALTDHDTVAGIEEASLAAVRCGIQLVPGVEISAGWRAQTIHVLGLWLDPTSGPLLLALDLQRQRRSTRIRASCARLDRQGLPGAALLAAVEARPGIPTRLHLAEALRDAGIVASTDHAFRRYLGRGKPGHVSTDWPPLAQVVGWILAAGGVAAIAHPARYGLSATARRRLLEEFKAAGGTTLEVVAGANGSAHVESSAALAVRFGFTGSAGSDFHTPEHIWNPLGRSLKLPDCVVPIWRAYGY